MPKVDLVFVRGGAPSSPSFIDYGVMLEMLSVRGMVVDTLDHEELFDIAESIGGGFTLWGWWLAENRKTQGYALPVSSYSEDQEFREWLTAPAYQKRGSGNDETLGR